MSTDKPKRAEIICGPVLTFTQADANSVSERCPYQYVNDAKNTMLVLPMPLTAELINERKGILHVAHYSQKEGEQIKLEGEWECAVPIGQTMNKNVFYVNI